MMKIESTIQIKEKDNTSNEVETIDNDIQFETDNDVSKDIMARMSEDVSDD